MKSNGSSSSTTESESRRETGSKRSRSADSLRSEGYFKTNNKSSTSGRPGSSSASSSKTMKNPNYTGGSNYSNGKTADKNGNRINQTNAVIQKKEIKIDENTSKYTRNEPLTLTLAKSVKHKGLRRTLQETHERIVDSASRTAATEVLLANKAGYIEAEHEGEKTYRLKQSAIKPQVDLNTQRKCISLSLPAFGPYMCNYSRYVYVYVMSMCFGVHCERSIAL